MEPGSRTLEVGLSGEEDLQAYRHEKLQLADVLLSLMHIAEARRDDERSKQVREISARLAEDRFQLAVVGQFSRGKSTLMNAVLGNDYLPTGALPMTSVITTVVYGSCAKATVWRRDGSVPIETPVSELVQYVAQASQQRQELAVSSALVELPAEVLRLGFCFVDTPGVGSAIVGNTKATEAFLPQADAVIFVSSFDSPLSEAELSFLRLVRQEVKRVFVVLNKRDLVSTAEAAEIEAFVVSRLKEVGIEEPDIFALSARDGLAAKRCGDLPGLLNSGLEALELELTDYLTTEKAREWLLRVGERADKVIASFASEARAAASLAEGGAPGALVDEFVDELLARLEADRGRLVSALEESTRQQTEHFSERMWPGLMAELMKVVGPEAGHPGGPQEGEGVLTARPDALTERLALVVGQWADKAVGQWYLDLEKASEPLLSGLCRIPGELALETARRFGTVAAPGGDGVSDRLPRIMPVRVEWTLAVPRDKAILRSQRRFARLLRDAVQTAAEGYVQRLAGAAGGSVHRWLADVGTWSQAELRGARDRVRARMATPADDNLQRELSALMSAIAASRSRLESWSTVRRRETPRPRVRAARQEMAEQGSGCVVCEQVVRALFEFMSHRQFELATRAGARSAHAAAKGFCAVHTWYYERIGSPIGISEAYAPLAEATADALLEAAAGMSSPAELQTALWRSSRPDCAACATLYSAQGKALGDVLADLARPGASPAVPALCLSHSAQVVSLALDEGLARQVVTATADRLKRRAEDMRSYSLKRQSLRRRFIDQEEETAYRDVLIRLVGHPLLAGTGLVEGRDCPR